MAENSQCGPCGLTQNQLINNGARLNGAFSEFAWANARQNSGCLPCPGEDLPAWPPALRDWGHTYPVQSKKGEEVLGSQMDTCGEAPFYIDPHPDFDQRKSNPPKVFDRFVTTDVPRGDSSEAKEYDLALDVAEKILQGNSLSMGVAGSGGLSGTPTNKPYSYFQTPYGIPPDGSLAAGPVEPGVCRPVPDLAGVYASGRRHSNKRLENLLEPVEQPYGAGSDKKDGPTDSHTWQNVMPCAQNSVKGIAYDLKHWNNITPEQCQGNKVYYVFARDDRWKYLTFVGICITIFILFIIAIACSVNNIGDSSHRTIAVKNGSSSGGTQKIELIIKQA